MTSEMTYFRDETADDFMGLMTSSGIDRAFINLKVNELDLT